MSVCNFSETELREFFVKSIRDRDDVNIYTEVPVFSRSVDLVIQNIQSARITAIEFKLHDWKRAIQQAQSVGLCFDFLYICLPKPKTSSSINNICNSCIPIGIGLILFDLQLNRFHVEVEASQVFKVWGKERSRIINYLEAKRDEERAFENP